MFREWKTSCSKKKNNRHLRELHFASETQQKCKLATETREDWDDEDEDHDEERKKVGGHSDGGTTADQFGQTQLQQHLHVLLPLLVPGTKLGASSAALRQRHIDFSVQAGEERNLLFSFPCLPQMLEKLCYDEHQNHHHHHQQLQQHHPPPPLPSSTPKHSLPIMSTSSAHFSAPPPFAKTITTKLSLTLGRPIISTHHHLLLPFILPLLILSLLFLSLPSPALCQQPSPSPPSPPPSPPSSPPASASRQQHRQQERSLGSSGGGKETLYIAGFFPTSRDKVEGATGRGVLPAVKLALQHVNESPLFTKYRLDLVWNDTKCDAGYGMKAFFGMLDEQPVKIILFGDACSVVTDPIAKAIKFFHLIQLSYADTFTATTANFFRIVPSEESFNPARVKLLKHYNWTHVGTIYQNTPRNSLPHSKLLAQLDHADIKILESQSIASELAPKYYFEKFKEKDVRIILGNFNETWAKRIFCQAFKDGMFGRRYQWIITGIYENNWWELNEEEAEALGCTTEDLLLAIDGYISTDVLPVVKNASTYYGFETSLYKSEYDRVRLKEYSRFHGYAYDGIWAIALAIQTVDKKLRMRNSHRTIEDFHYRDPFWATLFREALNETDFDGVTGHVSFDKNERRGIVLLQRFQRKTRTSRDIAQYITAADELQFVGEHIDWGGAKAPVDRVIERIVPSRISMTLFIVISVFAIIGIAFSFVFLAMNIKYRNQRYIKMSSPYLNNLIIIGCILTYTSVILLGLNSGLTSESNFPYICASRAWVLMTGFTLAFGSMFSKTWRVHAIFTDIKLNKKLIKDYKLFMVVGILVFIDVATLTTWQIVDPFYREISKGTPEASPQNEDLLIVPEMEYCTSQKMHIFLGSIYMYKGVLMAIGIFLAWETRQVSIPALNDSKYIGMSVYNVVIMCVIGAGLSYVLRDQQDAAFVIISIFIIFCSTATLLLVFVPKLIELKRNPNAGDRRVRATLKPFKKSHHDSDEIEIHTKIKLVTEDNFRFRQRLKEKSYELEALTFRLRALEESAKLVTSKSNEIIVEENDLKQLDNCDQRKLSVASVKQAVAAATKRRKSSNSVRQLIGRIEVAEESSTEIVVNSTSILELSSEAAQLTVKNGSVESGDEGDSGGGGGGGCGGDGIDRDSKSSDEMSITYRNMDMLNNSATTTTTSSSSHPHHPHHHHHHSHSHHAHAHHQSYANNIITVKANGKNTGDDSGGEQNSDELDSDDTSYAKAISQTIVSEVVVVPVVVEGASSLHHHHHHHHLHHQHQHQTTLPALHSSSSFHSCHSHSHPRALHVASTPCCHHHHLPPEHHHHHHPHHVQHESQPQLPPLPPPPPPPIGALQHYSHHLSNAATTAPGSSTTTSVSVGSGGSSSTGGGGGSYMMGSTLPMAVVKSRADQMASEVLQSALVAQHIHSKDGTEKSRRRRTQSFGGFLSNDNLGDGNGGGGGGASGLPFQLLMPPSEFSGTLSGGSYSTVPGTGGGGSGSPVRTCSSVDDTLNVGEGGGGGGANTGVTSASSYIRLFPYLNRSASIDQPQQSQALRRSGGQSCPSVDVRCDIVEYL